MKERGREARGDRREARVRSGISHSGKKRRNGARAHRRKGKNEI